MSLDDLEIKKHTAPILAELDSLRAEVERLRNMMTVCHDPNAVAERDSLRAQRDAAAQGSKVWHQAAIEAQSQRDAAVEALESVLERPMVEAEGTNPLVVTIHIAAERVEQWRAALLRAKGGGA